MSAAADVDVDGARATVKHERAALEAAIAELARCPLNDSVRLVRGVFERIQRATGGFVLTEELAALEHLVRTNQARLDALSSATDLANNTIRPVTPQEIRRALGRHYLGGPLA